MMPLRAGPLRMIFEPEGVLLRYLCLGERELLRGIYAAVRDANWGTVAPEVDNLRLETTPTTFRVTFEARHQAGDIDFVWQGELTGDASGTVRYVMDGSARTTFYRNRIGFCVLHPASCAGLPCTVETVAGEEIAGTFPDAISPHQPFMDMRAIRHPVDPAVHPGVHPGVTAMVRFEGDTFEMEDQRNWTDASFKTYCTPLALPFPALVTAGTRIRQVVTVTLGGAVEVIETPPDPQRQVTVNPTHAYPLPPLGLGVASHGKPLSEREIDRLNALALAHLRVDVRLYDNDVPTVLGAATEQASLLGVRLELALFVSDDAAEEFSGFTTLLCRLKPPVRRWLIFHKQERVTRARWLGLAREHLAAYEPNAPFVGGTDAYFTELNRERPETDVMDGVCYSLNPQVHAFDNASLIETLETQATTLQSAAQFAAGRPIAVAPVTLKPRWNPSATGPSPEPAAGELPQEVDPRQATLFAAGWTLGSLGALSAAGASSLTLFETTGWRGLMEREAGAPLAVFPSTPGAVFPLYHLFADVAAFCGGEVLASHRDDPLSVALLALRKGDARRTLVANLTPTLQSIRLSDPSLPRWVRVRRLDARTAETATRDPAAFRVQAGLLQETADGVLELTLPPHAYARIDYGERNV